VQLEEARALLASAADEGEDVSIPASLLSQLKLDDIPDGASFQVGTLQDGVLHLEWEGRLYRRGGTIDGEGKLGPNCDRRGPRLRHVAGLTVPAPVRRTSHSVTPRATLGPCIGESVGSGSTCPAPRRAGLLVPEKPNLTQKSNLPFWFFHSLRGGIVSMVSQCSAILPFSTRNRS
jgi:hypothetical protein